MTNDNKILVSEKEPYWLGATNFYDKNKYEWQDPLRPLSFNYFHPTEPNRPTIEHCMCFWLFGDGTYKWGDLECYLKINFMCQR